MITGRRNPEFVNSESNEHASGGGVGHNCDCFTASLNVTAAERRRTSVDSQEAENNRTTWRVGDSIINISSSEYDSDSSSDNDREWWELDSCGSGSEKEFSESSSSAYRPPLAPSSPPPSPSLQTSIMDMMSSIPSDRSSKHVPGRSQTVGEASALPGTVAQSRYVADPERPASYHGIRRHKTRRRRYVAALRQVNGDLRHQNSKLRELLEELERRQNLESSQT